MLPTGPNGHYQYYRYLFNRKKEQLSGACFVSFTISGSVVDPDPYVFGLPGSGSGSFYYQAKKVRKTLLSTVL
jgi:hypothetical protein